MIGRKAGAGLFLLSILALSGCAGPLSQRDAVQLANTSLRKYCSDHGGCAQLRLAHAQKIKNRWLIEYDGTANTYGVAVNNDGNTDVSVWEKNLGAAH